MGQAGIIWIHQIFRIGNAQDIHQVITSCCRRRWCTIVRPEFAYAKALGLLEIQPSKPSPSFTRDPPSSSYAESRPRYEEKSASLDDDFEAAVQREMRLLESSMQNIYKSDAQSTIQVNNVSDDAPRRSQVPRNGTYESRAVEYSATPERRRDAVVQPARDLTYSKSPSSDQILDERPKIANSLSPARRIGGGLKNLYGPENDSKAAIKAAYAKLLQQQVCLV